MGCGLPQNQRVATLLPRPDPLRAGARALHEAQRLCAAGRPAEGLAALEAAYAAGCRYKKEWLGRPTLAPLAALSAFPDFATRANARYEEAAALAKPRLMFAVPDTLPDAFGYPLLVVLHGNNSNSQETASQWEPMADKGWIVAVPQSGEIGATPESYTWNDRERTARELDVHIERLKSATQIDTSRIVLAGFSMGGTQAIALALTKRFIVRGVVPICVWLPDVEEYRRLIEGGAAKMLRAYVIAGADDPARDGARALVEVLQAHKIRAQLDERAGLGHKYPADMEDTLTKALAFVTS